MDFHEDVLAFNSSTKTTQPIYTVAENENHAQSNTPKNAKCSQIAF